MSESNVDVRVEQVPCMICGKSLSLSVLYMNGKRAPTPGALCFECGVEEELHWGPSEARPIDIKDWLRSVGVNTRKHGNATFESFNPTDALRALDAAKAFVDSVVVAGRHDRVRGLYLAHENTGTGKSHLAVAAMRAIHERAPGLIIVFDPADRLITRVQDSYGTGTTDALIETRASADVYVLDDLGREKGTDDALRVLATILDEREGAPTIITSNFLPNDLGARYKDNAQWGRVLSRLGDEVYRFVMVNGPDRRFQT